MIMENKEAKYSQLKERFLKIYSNLPINLRDEIIYVIKRKGPITWNVAYLEAQGDTDLAKTLLYNLEELGVI